MGGPLRNDFRTIYFTKTGAEIIEASKHRRENLITRVAEREAKILALLEKYELTTIEVMGLMTKEQGFTDQLSNSYIAELRSASNAKLIANKGLFGAAEWDAINGEHTRRMEELDEVANMTLVIKHLRPTDEFKLTKHDLDYYEF